MTSLTLQAKILGLSVVGVGLLGITIASPLVVDQPSLDNIKIGKIFLSASGTATTSGQSKITLDGSNGSIELEGALRMPGYGNDCPTSTGCILGTDADGKVKLSSINIIESFGGGTTESGDPTPTFFTRRGGNTAQVDTGASEIVFYDRTIIGNNASSDVSLRIGLSGAINAASQGNGKTVDVAGPIMSRTALSLESPIDTNQSSDYLFSPNRTNAVIQKSTSSDTIEAMKLQIGHTSDDGASYDRSDFIIESLSNSIKARLGINTPNYPSKELDINGQTLSRGNLIIGSDTNPTLFANNSTKKVGINMNPSRATFDVNGSSKFNGSLSIQGTPEHIANITNGMTSVTLGEITNNETGSLRTLADVGCKLLTVDSNGNLVLEQIPEDICHGTTEPETCTTGPSTGRIQTDECLPNNRVFNPDDLRINHPQYINKCLAKNNTDNTCRVYSSDSIIPNGYTSVNGCYEGLSGDPSYQAVMLKPVTQSCTVCPTGQHRDTNVSNCMCNNSDLKPMETVTIDDGGQLIYTSGVCEAPHRQPNSTACNGSTYTVSYTCKANNTTIDDSYCSQPKPSNQTANCSPSQPLKMYQCSIVNNDTVWTEIIQDLTASCHESTYGNDLSYYFFNPYTLPIQYYKVGSYVCSYGTPSISCLGGHGWINLSLPPDGPARCECDNSGRRSGCSCSNS